MTEYFKFWCPKCGSDRFIKKELVEMITSYYNPPVNYNIFSTINGGWAWSSETTTEDNEVNIPSFFCESCNYHVGDFKHTEKFIENGFKEGYIIKYEVKK